MASSDATWHVYLLRCADDTLYCGVTTDLDRRLAQVELELRTSMFGIGARDIDALKSTKRLIRV